MEVIHEDQGELERRVCFSRGDFESFFLKLLSFQPWCGPEIKKVSWDEDSPSNHFFLHGVPHFDLSGNMWYEFTESLLILPDITKAIKEIIRRKYGYVPLRSVDLPVVVFEANDSLQGAEKLINALLRFKDYEDDQIEDAIKGLKKTRSTIASRMSNIRKRLEQRISN